MNAIDTSILVLNRNRIEITRECIDSIIKFRNPKSDEIILLDNASTDGSHELFTEYEKTKENFRIIRFNTPLSLMHARNAGLDQARGKEVLSLDNDVTWTGDVLSVLRNTAMLYPDCGVVGMCAVFIPSLTQYIHVHQNLITQPVRADATTGYCMFFTKFMVENRFRFDGDLDRFAGEDIDLCIQITKAKFGIYIAPKVPLIHHEHGSRAFLNGDYSEIMGNNHAYILKKWQNEYVPDIKTFGNALTFVTSNNAITLTLTTKGISFFDITRLHES